MPKVAVRLSVHVCWVFALFLLTITDLQGKDYCAIRVELSAKPGTSLPIRLDIVSPVGRIENTLFVMPGLVDICDIGFGKHAVVVDRQGCFPTTISNVAEVFGSTTLLYATANPCGARPHSNGCPVILRVKAASDGTAVRDAVIKWRGSPIETKTDSYGRAWVALPAGRSEELLVSAASYQNVTIPVQCAQEDSIIERLISLQQTGGR